MNSFKIEELFSLVEEINRQLENLLLEISVKRHQISFLINYDVIRFNGIQSLLELADKNNYDESFLSYDKNNDIFSFLIGGLSLEEIDEKNILYPFLCTIEKMAQEICSCPSLEFVISPQYIKCYLDKPGLKISDLSNYEKIFNAEGQAELELHPQRPYLLFLNMSYTDFAAID